MTFHTPPMTDIGQHSRKQTTRTACTASTKHFI